MNAEIQKHYGIACDIASQEVEKIARDILKKHKHLKEFVMAMGTYSFTDREGKDVDPLSSIYRNGSYTYVDRFAYFKPLNDLIFEWDSVLKMTGDAMRFTVDSPKITDW